MLCNNYQEQSDEIDALVAIYEEEIDVLYKSTSYDDSSITNLQVELPVMIPDHGVHFNLLGLDNDQIGSIQFQYLPPITLSISLPKEYPSDKPPDFSIICEWLSQKNLFRFCEELDTICDTEQGCPVLFSLCNWIQCDSLEFLLSDESSINLQANSENIDEFDSRGVSLCKNIEDTVRSLMRYNREKRIEAFYKESHECKLCFDELPGEEFEILQCCESAYCKECIKDMCSRLVHSGSLDLLNCPNCETEFHPNFLKANLSEEEMDRWERLKLQKTLDAMSDVHYCPRCESIVIADEDNFAHCTNCRYAFCSICSDDYHSNSSCDEMTAIMKKIKKSKDKANELKSLRYIKKRARQCPTCKIFINRSEGCNKMTCAQCRTYFCYSCGIQISGYDHFNTTPGKKGGCKIFDEVTDDMLLFYGNMQGYDGFIAENGDMNHFAEIRRRYKNCPYCGQQNPKIGRNNDIGCYHCKNHFCFLCKSKIKGTSHFAKTECIQHSD